MTKVTLLLTLAVFALLLAFPAVALAGQSDTVTPVCNVMEIPVADHIPVVQAGYRDLDVIVETHFMPTNYQTGQLNIAASTVPAQLTDYLSRHANTVTVSVANYDITYLRVDSRQALAGGDRSRL